MSTGVATSWTVGAGGASACHFLPWAAPPTPHPQTFCLFIQPCMGRRNTKTSFHLVLAVPK